MQNTTGIIPKYIAMKDYLIVLVNLMIFTLGIFLKILLYFRKTHEDILTEI